MDSVRVTGATSHLSATAVQRPAAARTCPLPLVQSSAQASARAEQARAPYLALAAPVLALHSTDTGATWANEHGAVLGQMITAMSFPSAKHGYATTVNALQISSLLEYA